MTSESEALKTNEFLRRRKLRIQQVREQSKEIAKKIRLRAKVEKLKHIGELDSLKEQEYFKTQEKLVKRLEDLYTKSLENVGESHKNASEVIIEETVVDKIDLSKKRGRSAVAELRRRKQEKLNEQKKILDRKLQAREIANELSREKSFFVFNKLTGKSLSNKGIEASDSKPESKSDSTDKHIDNLQNENNKPVVEACDMATQWDFDNIPNEWEPNVPELILPDEDGADLKDVDQKNVDDKSDKSKRLNLFALSEDMPSSLRGGLPANYEKETPEKISLTLISEHLQNRVLRLREPDVTKANSKHVTDLQSIKQTLLRVRSTQPEVSSKQQVDLLAAPIEVQSSLSLSNSVRMYNHFTRGSTDVPYGDTNLVQRNPPTDDDAYSQAMKESSNVRLKDKDHHKKLQDMRNKIAMSKQNVEKEYRDTMTFLNSLPKDKTKLNKHVYMDEARLRMQKETRQRKMQQKFQKIQQDFRRDNHQEKIRLKNKSPVKFAENDFDSNDFQYSWMPVPESDNNLAVHTIPTKLKDTKCKNNVKFSKVDSYHEYRSRHKHTPPTKDNMGLDKHATRQVTEPNRSEQNDVDYVDESSTYTDTSSVENLQCTESGKQKTKQKPRKFSGTERVVIYKILDEKLDRDDNEKERSKLIEGIAKSLTAIEKDKIKKALMDSSTKTDEVNNKKKQSANNPSTNISIEKLDEGIYETVNENRDNISSIYFSDNHAENRENLLDNKDPPASQEKHTEGCRKDVTKMNTLKTAVENQSRSCTKENTKRNKKKNSFGPVIESSEAGSALSFKTANGNKNIVPDGCIKLIDDDGHETGKFYIGTSDLLKNDGYEVIIQLRKKEELGEIEKKDSITRTELSKNSNGKSNSIDLQPFTEIISITSVQDQINNVNKNKDISTQIPIAQSENSMIDKTDFNENVTSNSPLNEITCAGVNPAFQVPCSSKKTNSVNKPTTSIYTQTSFSTPDIVRPTYMHMSSSTSTAYMSPPEEILPICLKQNYHENRDIKKMRDEGIQFPDTQTYNKHRSTDKKHCTHARNIYISKPIPRPLNLKTAHDAYNINTPPNTVRSSKHGFEYDIDNLYENRNGIMSENICSNKHECRSTRCHKYRRGTGRLNKRSSRNSIKQVHPCLSSSFRYTNKYTQNYSSTKLNKVHLNPILKTYVHQLLTLNKEGLKAVEVMNQDCSSVATPASSVINVPRNNNENKSILESKLSLERIKSILVQQYLENYGKIKKKALIKDKPKIEKCVPYNFAMRLPKKKSLHKVKSLNISKRLFRSDTKLSTQPNSSSEPNSTAPKKIVESNVKPMCITKSRSKSSPSPRQSNNEIHVVSTLSDTNNKKLSKLDNKANEMKKKSNSKDIENKKFLSFYSELLQSQHGPRPQETDSNSFHRHREGLVMPQSISTQTKKNSDNDKENDYMKLAEDKIQNMEKIAELTEKCTKRLSNLAKALDEVRKNKSLACSQISDSLSDSEKKEVQVSIQNKPTTPTRDLLDLGKELLQHDGVTTASPPILHIETKLPSQFRADTKNVLPHLDGNDEDKVTLDPEQYAPIFENISEPEPNSPKIHYEFQNTSDKYIQSLKSASKERQYLKNRGKPPPASAKHLKNAEDNLVPHELSTVLEVDSPSAVKFKNKTGYSNKITELVPNLSNISIDKSKVIVDNITELIDSNIKLIKRQKEISSNESLDSSKLQMMDLKQFNEIMLKPFISLREYANQCHGGVFDEGSNIDDIPKEDDVSSSHSDGSLPDVIAELLKRNIINEPFKFDTVSNVNSTSLSTESTFSVLALSKVRKSKPNGAPIASHRDIVAETSDTLSISSNPDLENAFKKLGMGWASSTLKKTKERLALSSSSNTSSSSGTRFKLKTVNNHDNIPIAMSDSVSSHAPRKPNKVTMEDGSSEKSHLQTSMTKTMTVNEFLANELSKKITFTNRSRRDETEEFVSLYETKMPEEMKYSPRTIREDRSVDSGHNGSLNKARTSTPVQIFRSVAYQSSSSSNLSNGLFSNADDLSSVKGTSNSIRNHSTSDKDDLTIPTYSLRMKKNQLDCTKSD